MKKKTILRIVILFLCFIAMAGAVLFCHAKRRARKEWARQGLLAIDYREQNGALPRVAGHPINEEYYVGYDAVNEAELYVQLTAYNEWLQLNKGEEQELTLEDFKEYLASEYNADGSLRIQEGYENIRAYVNWYWRYGGATDIAKYWDELEVIENQHVNQNPTIIYTPVRDLDKSQLQELINKRNDPFYEINDKVMQGEK